MKKVAVDDSAKYEEVYDLNDKDDFKKLAEGTDMNYHGVSSNTNVVYWNGMDNTEEQAQKTQEMIQMDFPDINVGLFNNKTGGISADVLEWMPNYLTTKDVVNAHMLQQLAPNTHVITHSAGNEDINKANQVNSLVNTQTPYIHTSVGSPTSETKLRESAQNVGATFNTQINHKNDPVPNGWINKDANYEINYDPYKKGLINKIPIAEDLLSNHPFENYYNEGVREEIERVNK